MELAEESEHQRMGLLPSKAKVTAQSPWQTMEVFIRSSAPSPLNVCKSIEKQSWPWYQQANSVLEKKYSLELVTMSTTYFKFQLCFTRSDRSCFLNNLRVSSQGFQKSSLRRSEPLRVLHISMYIHTEIPSVNFQGFQETCIHMLGCQHEPKPTKPNFKRE